jgi:hypothetical protein
MEGKACNKAEWERENIIKQHSCRKRKIGEKNYNRTRIREEKK